MKEMDEHLERRITRYLQGEMEAEERQAFEVELSQNPDLKKEVADLRALEEGLEAVGFESFKSEVRSWDKAAQRPPKNNWKPLAIAAAIALLVVPAIYLFQGVQPGPEDLFMAYYEPYEEQILARGMPEDSASLDTQALIDGLEAYNAGSYQSCSELLSRYLDQNPQEHRVALYLAIAQMELNLMDLAETNFTRAQKDPDFKQQAQWYQALAYLKFDKPQEASGLLEIIAMNKNHYRATQAGDLLKEL